MIATVVPLARETYERKEEQNFREWVRRNLMETQNAASTVSESLRALPEYADDAAAAADNLQPGQFYRTATGQVMVKL